MMKLFARQRQSVIKEKSEKCLMEKVTYIGL